MGLSRRKVVVSIYAITLIFLVMGFMAFWSRGQLVPVLLGMAALILLLCAGKLSFSREWFAVGRVLGNSLGMRQEIQYALCLIRWLAMEGGRRSSPGSLWPDLAFVAQRLGFTYVKLTLADGSRVWEQPEAAGPVHYCRQELQGGRCGVLELKAPSASEPSARLGEQDPATLESELTSTCLADPKLFGIMSELVAEGWLNATRVWQKGDHHLPLRFSSKAALAQNLPHRRPSRPFAPVPPLKDTAEGTVGP
jgi:hypothetical protein